MDGVGATRQAEEYREIGAAIRARSPRPNPRVSRRAMLTGSLTLAAGGYLTASGFFGPASGLLSDYATRVGGRERITLADGSVVSLNTATALSVDFTVARRVVTLHAGEALFEVARDKARPFIVRSGGGEAQAVGTVYSVRRRGPLSDVVVTEGIVAVNNGAETVRLTAGQSIAYGDGIHSAVAAVDGAAATAWSRGKLIFNRRPLGEVAAELERYQLGKVIVRGERLKRLEVTGVFELDDSKALLQAISARIKVPVTRLPLLTIIG
jgi:transmembrane sensor